MDYGRFLEKLMVMDDASWKRHANPWSVWTRVAILPLFVLTIWYRDALGWWIVLPLALLVLWTYVNPRAFPPPATTRTWASQATFGERVWLTRKTRPIPDHHVRMAHILSGLSALALIPLVYGLYAYMALVTGLGLVLLIISKFWFLDRMVWLYHDSKDSDPEYGAWLY